MIELIVACAFFSAPIPGPSEWTIATIHSDAGGFEPRPGPLCGEVGQTKFFVLVNPQNITTEPVTVTWLEDYDEDGDGRIRFDDVVAQPDLGHFTSAALRVGECNDGKQVIECE